MGRRSFKAQTYLDYLYALDYKQKPATVDEFINNEEFLGIATAKGKGIYPIWRKALKEIFAEDSAFLVVLTGAIGTGKTYIDVIAMAMVMHRILCLKDPWGYFNLAAGGKMAIAFFNLTKTLSQSKGFSLLQSFLMDSPWFMSRGRVRGSKDKYLEFPLFQYVLASPGAAGFGTVGESVICASMDEVDSFTVSDKQKLKVLKAYESTVRRFISRFVINDESLGRFFLVSSKQDEMSFLNAFVDEMKDTGRVAVFDVALWEAKPSSNYCGDKFPVCVGDIYTIPKILLLEQEVKKALADGLEVINVPIEYRKDFERDIVGALRDIAGKSAYGSRKSKLFPSEKLLNDCYDPDRVNPAGQRTIEIGVKDRVDLLKYIDFDLLSLPKNIPRYIHQDIAYSGEGDALGLSMSGVCGWTTSNIEKSDGSYGIEKVPVIETDFSMRIKARSGDRIPLHKVRQLVISLKRMGFNIQEFTSDLRLASEDTFQLLERAGIKTSYLSLDKDVSGYLQFRELVFEQRWVCYKDNYLHFELKNLIYNTDIQKIDHPDKVTEVVFMQDGGVKEIVLKGSKDVSDGVVGSVVNASRKSKMPASAKAMRAVAKKAAAHITPKEDKIWWMDGIEQIPQKEENIIMPMISEQQSEQYIELLKKMRES